MGARFATEPDPGGVPWAAEFDDACDLLLLGLWQRPPPGPTYQRPVSKTFVKRVRDRRSGMSLPGPVLNAGFR